MLQQDPAWASYGVFLGRDVANMILSVSRAAAIILAPLSDTSLVRSLVGSLSLEISKKKKRSLTHRWLDHCPAITLESRRKKKRSGKQDTLFVNLLSFSPSPDSLLVGKDI